MAWRFEVTLDRADESTWRLVAENNEIVAWAGESFDSLYNAQRAVENFKARAHKARFEVYPEQGGTGRWRWRAYLGSRKVAASGQSFPSQLGAAEAGTRVQLRAGKSILDD